VTTAELITLTALDFKVGLGFLVITNKLMTGFDAPIEGVLYLDKPIESPPCAESHHARRDPHRKTVPVAAPNHAAR
jgi:hypothetical protein